ncbi:MAG: cytochrome c biogenesis protein CcsA [Salibacteraceae bacterium]
MTNYPGEHLFIGALGNVFVVLSFALSLLAAISYGIAEFKKDRSYLLLGRFSIMLHMVSVAGMVAVLLTMILNQYFEYHYVWQHSNSEMPLKYVFSSFWEGIEGSFMMWTFWHVVLMVPLLKYARNWEAPVFSVMALIQVFMTSMLLGVYVFDYKIGSNPFTVLLREVPEYANLPLFQNKNYTEVLDGRGLNPLLQNYWMVIHPPLVLFGFATTAIPFAFAISGLWRGLYIDWVKPALSWTFFAVGILGTGLLMGGAWAYEALSFGGFWAWDPVENASLVPWLTLVGAGHLMLVQRKKGASVFSLFLFTTLTFCLVQYSSFLTKSGVLGDSSVHSFTDLGMTGQLAVSLGFFFALSAALILFRWRQFPKLQREESVWSREFWMFVGALILFVSAFQIGFSTSFPVINKIFGTNFAQSAERIAYYNKWQMPLGIVISLLIAAGQFLKYDKTNPGYFWKNISISAALAVGLTVAMAIWVEMTRPLHLMLMFSSTLAVTANLDYWIRILNGKLKSAGASIAHIGMGLILLGALISAGESRVISQNTSLFDVTVLGEDFSNNENILLMKDDTLLMGDYFVSYRGKERDGHFVKFEVDYLVPDDNGNLKHAFSLYPYVQLNPRMGNVAEPYTKHFIDKDLYTHINYAELESSAMKDKHTEHQIKLGDTIFNRATFMVLDSLDRNPSARYGGLNESDIALGAFFTLYDRDKQSHQLEPLYVIRNRQYAVSVPDSIPELGIVINFINIDPNTQTFGFEVIEKPTEFRDFIVMRAIIFPGINILWLGCVLMALGTFFAVIARIRRA